MSDFRRDLLLDMEIWGSRRTGMRIYHGSISAYDRGREPRLICFCDGMAEQAFFIVLQFLQQLRLLRRRRGSMGQLFLPVG